MGGLYNEKRFRQCLVTVNKAAAEYVGPLGYGPKRLRLESELVVKIMNILDESSKCLSLALTLSTDSEVYDSKPNPNLFVAVPSALNGVDARTSYKCFQTVIYERVDSGNYQFHQGSTSFQHLDGSNCSTL